MIVAARLVAARAVLKRNRLPVTMPAEAILTFQLVLFVDAFQRGADYVRIPEGLPPSPALSAIERSLDLDIWGWALIGLALMGIAGLWTRLLPLAPFAHPIVGIIYVAFGAGVFNDSFNSSQFFGWRGAGGFLFVAALHFLAGWRSQIAWRGQISAEGRLA